MTTRKKGATLVGLPDRFVAVEIEAEAPPAFDAAQYSFFGDLSAADSGLEGALEDGLEAPPAEDGLSQDYGLHAAEEEALPLDEDEDLSVASIFRNQLGLGAAKTPTKRVDPDEDAGLDALLTDPLSVARKQLRDDDYDHRELPAELYPDTAATAQPQSLFGATASPYALFDGRYGGMLGASQATAAANDASNAGPDAAPPQPQPSQPGTTNAAVGSALLQMLKKPSQQPVKVMTLDELEARILGSAEAPSAPAGGRVSGPDGISPDALAAVGHDQQLQHQQQAAALLTRPLPGTPVSGGGGSGGGARGHAAPGPRVPPGGMPGVPQPPPPPGAFPPNMQLPGAHGLVLQQGPPPLGLQHQQQLHHHPHMHGAPPPHGPMPMHMMQPGSPGPGMYPPHPMMGPGPQPPNLMYNGNGMMPPPPHHHNHPPGPGMMSQGHMGPLPYGHGPGGMYPPRGPMPPYGPGPMGMGGPPPYMHDGYHMRPMGPPPGMPGPMHGMPARPGPFGYGPPALGPGPGPQQQQVPLPGQPRPGLLAGPLLATAGPGGGERLGPVLGPGAAGGRPAGQVRQGNGPQAASDLGQQFSRACGATAASGPIALAAAAAAGRAGGAPSGPGGRLGGKWMRQDDVEYVVRSMLYTVANGVPYVEDFYYQAFVHKHVSQPSRRQLSPGAFPMAAPFVPEALRELSEDQMSMMRLDPSARAKFVEGLQGLGKIVLSNIRTPKVLMDLSDRGVKGSGEARARTASAADGEGSTDVSKGSDQQGRCGGAVRPLEQEPLLAARIMIEDCMNLLLDVDDIDRLANHMAALPQAQQRAVAVAAVLPHPGAAPAAAAVAAAAPPVGPYGPSAAVPPPATQLRQRRELLLAGINGAFRLPNAPKGAVATTLSTEGSMDLDTGAGSARAAASLGDGVLVRILAISKGRGVVARALLAITPPGSLVEAPSPKPSPSALPERDTKVWAEAATSIVMGNGNGSDAVQNGGGSDAPAAATTVIPLLPDDVAPASTTGGEAGGVSLLGSDAPSPFALLWGTLRNSWAVFGTSLLQGLDPATERPFLEATARLAAALREALLRLATPRDVVDAAAAFNVGCQQHVEALCVAQGGGASAAAVAASMEAALLPLAQTRAVEAAAEPSVAAAPVAWLGEALAALVTRASQLGLTTTASSGSEDAAAGGGRGGGTSLEDAGAAAAVSAEWRREYDALQERLTRHLEALGGIHTMAAASGNAEALAVVRSLSCRLLVNAMLQHASSEQAQQLKAALAALSA